MGRFFFGQAGAGKIEFGEFVIQKWLRSRGICRLPGMETGRLRIDWGLQAMEFDTFADGGVPVMDLQVKGGPG